MAIQAILLDQLSKAGLERLVLHAWRNVQPEIVELLSDPSGALMRVGDALLWSSPSGTKLIGGLETLTDSQARIEAAVNGIETVQVSMQGALGVVSNVSFATLGIASLSGAFMAMRLNAIDRRITDLQKAIKDVEGHLNAQSKAHLRNSLQNLREYDSGDSPDELKLRRALDEARTAANIYGQLVDEEVNGQARLPVLNCRGRLYVLAFLTELRCLMSSPDSKQTKYALDRIKEEEPIVRKLAARCFDKTLGKCPERYLRPALQPQGVGIELLATIYRTSNAIEVEDIPKVDDTGSLFEHLRAQIGGINGRWGWNRPREIAEDLGKIRYLLACVEEVARIFGLKHIIEEVNRRGGSVSVLVDDLMRWRKEQQDKERSGKVSPTFEYDSPPVFSYVI